MKPSEQAKAAGFRSLKQVSEIVGLPTRTLQNWHRNKPKLFAVVLAGAVALHESQR